MTVEQIGNVIDTWTEQYVELGGRDWITAVQIFENRGEMMGASNPHPHCQIWSNETLPNEHTKELASFRDFRAHKGRCLLCEYVRIEQSEASRIICENDSFLAIVPFWAVWPFEAMVVSKRHFGSFDQMEAAEKNALADVMKRLTTRYDNLFETSFPYTMGFHQKPTDGGAHEEWHFHAHYYPRYCALPPCVSLWWATRCSARHNGTLHRNRRPTGFGTCLRRTSSTLAYNTVCDV